MPWEIVEDELPSKSFEQSAQELGSNIQRNIARTGSNLVTRAIGIPGDIMSLVNEYIARPIQEGITGKEGSRYEETLLGKLIPTTQFHRKGIESATGEFLKPQNKVEQFFDDVIEDTALMFMPGGMLTRSGKVLTGGQKAYRNFSKAVGANLVGEGIESFGGDESSKNWGKVGSLFLLSMIDKPAAAKQVANLYKQAEASIPKGAMVNARPLEKEMTKLINDIQKGRPKGNLSSNESFVVDQAEKVLNLIEDRNIPVDQAWAQLRTVNNELQRILPELPWGQRKGIKTQVNRVNKALNNTLDEYGKHNSKFAQSFKPAQEAFGAIAKSNFVGNWVQKNLKSPIVSEGLLMLMGSGLSAKVSSLAIPYKATQVMYRIQKSPALRQMYADTLKAAAKEDAKAFNKYLSALDKQIQREESEEEWEILD